MSHKILLPNPSDLVARYLAGESENSLAHEVSVSRDVIRRTLLEAGIMPRSQSQSEIIKWRQMSVKKRRSQTRAAHEACRGRVVDWNERCLRAKTREGNLRYNVSPSEIELGKWLTGMGINVTHNFAVGPYNCDIGAGAVVVEVWGGGWHPKVGEIERTKYILDAGYSILFVATERRRFPIAPVVTEYIVTLSKFASGDPSMPRQYWMVRGDGELIFKRFNDDNISLVPPFTAGRDAANGRYKRVPR